MGRLHPADADDRRFGVRGRYGRLLFRLYSRRECSRSAACFHAQRRALLFVRDCVEPHYSQSDNVFLVSWSRAVNLDGDVAIRFDRVSKSIGTTRILEDVSFEIPRGTAFSILGRRGTGKNDSSKIVYRPAEAGSRQNIYQPGGDH